MGTGQGDHSPGPWRNHDYRGVGGAAAYFRYFGAAAGHRFRGYYSFDLGAWHLIALNSNCGRVGGCQAGSPQERWLRADLARHPSGCTLAYWHRPRFSSRRRTNDGRSAALWRDLYRSRADLVLNGHDHDYERFGPLDPRGSRTLPAGCGSSWSAPAATAIRQSRRCGGAARFAMRTASACWSYAPPQRLRVAFSPRRW